MNEELRKRIKELHNTPDSFLRLEVNNFYLWFVSNYREQDWYQDLIDFHEQVILDNFPKRPYIPDEQRKLLRSTLIKEEIAELLSGIDKNNLVEIADGIVDSIVVLLGTAITYGIDIRPIWDEIHKSNMAKKGGKLREDGKILKPEGWKAPEVARIIEEQQNDRNSQAPI